MFFHKSNYGYVAVSMDDCLILRLMYAIVDVETTGGRPSTDRIVEIAIVVYDGEQILEKFSTLVNPKRPIDSYVTKLTGITDEMVKKSPTFEDIHAKILELTHERIFVAHNVKFDFGMLRQEFRRIGIDYNRRQIDTVNLARKLLPGFSSYSLGNICSSIGIDIHNRHRALGDAEATARLLSVMLAKNNASKYIEIELNQGIDIDLLPPYLSKAEIEKLPEDPGVYYFRDEVGRVLFVEGVKNIRRKVIQYFSAPPDDSPAKRRLFELIRTIDYELTGNELVARLVAHRSALVYSPEFNKRVTVPPVTHGIFLKYDEHGLARLTVSALDEGEGKQMLRFTSRAAAHKLLAKINRETGLRGWGKILDKLRKDGKAPDKKLIAGHNKIIENAIGRYVYRQPDFFIVLQGIHPDSLCAVYIENNQYRGYGYFDPELTPATPENLREIIKPDEDDAEVQKIIRNYLRKSKNVKIIKC
ncbi:MAG: exonuclease domain-containing protein [Chitinophagales bacterium]|nr:exonuclease domain-containing protein [Chitinophagales bacterium]MDW8419827.1 exonuclease domain-containing protein [Chitinophagales bacterium]